jgi:hypothetical protein
MRIQGKFLPQTATLSDLNKSPDGQEFQEEETDMENCPRR